MGERFEIRYLWLYIRYGEPFRHGVIASLSDFWDFVVETRPTD